MAEYWNHNVHYHPVVLAAMPRGCTEALDVGCGDGLLARKLAGRALHVTGVDASHEMIVKARRLSGGLPNVDFVEADFLALPPPDPGYDFVASVAAIHHMDFTAALTAMRDRLRPGGSLAVISLARDGHLEDRLRSAAGLPLSLLHRLTKGKGDPGAPIRDPEMTYDQVRDEALRLLPGARFRRHPLWRYSIFWHRPR